MPVEIGLPEVSELLELRRVHAFSANAGSAAAPIKAG
jgi:hypothetical protein